MKKKILLLAVAAICVAILASGTLAYFVAEDTAHNIITTAGVGIEIEEWQESEGGLVPYPDEPVAVMPGAVVSKIATVKSTEEKAYIRAKYEIVLTDAKGNVVDLTHEQLAKAIKINVDEAHWLDNGDGWWYFDESVSKNDVTSAFFTQVEFDKSAMTNEYQECTVDITVIAQAVQAANNGSTALEAAGWPQETA